jgi:hypothetical protein
LRKESVILATYSRRSNTNGWRVRVERLIGEGERLKDKPLELFNSIEDFERHKGEVDEWVKRIAYQMHMIFNDKSLIDEFAPPITGVDLEEMSHYEIFRSLQNEVDVRLRGLRRLIEEVNQSEGRA